MGNKVASWEETVLCWGETNESKVNAKQLSEFVLQPENVKEEIGDFVYNRLFERYIEPFKKMDNSSIDYGQHNVTNDEEPTQRKLRIGFSIMANMCLLIETMEAFKKGFERFYGRKKGEELNDTHYEQAFIDFFDQNEEFKVSKGFGCIFYRDIRCAILHQGETYNGWKIKPIEEIKPIDEANKTIDAKQFLDTMENVLKTYIEKLKSGEESMENCVKKLNAIIKNCK